MPLGGAEPLFAIQKLDRSQLDDRSRGKQRRAIAAPAAMRRPEIP